MTQLHKGNPDCRHTWVYDDAVICTLPPICHRICSQCGRVEHVQGELSQVSVYEEFYGKFHQ